MISKSVIHLMLSPFEELAYCQGAVLTGITIKVKEDSYLMMIKARFRIDGHRICYIESKTLLGCWEIFHAGLHTTSIALQWRKDKWAPSD